MAKDEAKVAVCEAKIDAIKEDIHEIKGDIKDVKKDLAEHMRRTDLLEQNQAGLRKQSLMIVGIFLVVQVLSSGGVEGLKAILPLLTKLFGL